MPGTETFFITGFPGFIANRLVDRLAKLSGKFILLVQPSLWETAIEEIADIAKRSGRPSSDFRLLQGDITLPNWA